MALLKSWGDTNKITDRALSVRYRITPVFIAPVATEGVENNSVAAYAYDVTRYAMKNYRFVGMDYETSKRCRDAKLVQYRRGVWEPFAEGGYETMRVASQASVTLERDGDTCSVVISVNETDSLRVVSDGTPPKDPATLFSALNEMDYDESGFAIKIESIFDGGDVDFYINFKRPANVRNDRLVFQFEASTGAWYSIVPDDFPLPMQAIFYGGISGRNPDGGFRIIYGDYISPVWRPVL